MASTYTVNTGIELIANGEQSGTWGTTTNVNLEIIDRLTNGVGAITLSGTTHTLTTTDGTLSDGQFKVLVFGGSPSGTNTVTISPNDQEKQYFILRPALTWAWPSAPTCWPLTRTCRLLLRRLHCRPRTVRAARLWLQTDRAPSALEVQAFQLVRPSQWQLFLAEEKINGSPEYR
jgi:hypothetical protein